MRTVIELVQLGTSLCWFAVALLVARWVWNATQPHFPRRGGSDAP